MKIVILLLLVILIRADDLNYLTDIENKSVNFTCGNPLSTSV
jgi:hypothetical protein